MIKAFGIRCVTSRIFPPKGYKCCTFFGIVIFRGTLQDFLYYVNTPVGSIGLNHERIHIVQGKTLGWLKFYWLYFKYYLKARKYVKKYLAMYLEDSIHHLAYRRIPFELEAYTHEEDYTYNETHWEEYITF